MLYKSLFIVLLLTELALLLLLKLRILSKPKRKRKRTKDKSRIMLAKISSTRLREKNPIEGIYTYHFLVSDLFKRTLDFKVKQPYL